MSRTKRLFKFAALTSCVAALANLAGVAMAGSNRIIVPTVVGGVLWLLFAIGLNARKRWLAYFAFLLAVISGLYVFTLLGIDGPVPQWLMIAIVGLNLLLAAVLFLIIWRKPEET